MGRRKKSERGPKTRSADAGEPAPVALRALAKGWLAVAMVVAAGVGLFHADRYVHALPRLNQPPVIELVDVPAGLRDTMQNKLSPFQANARYQADTCAEIGRALEAEPWVRAVRSVRRTHDMRVQVSCEYRIPSAMVQRGNEFYLVDRDRVRLPGVYGYHEGLLVIQGAESAPPPPGRVWPGDDLAAGLSLAALVAREPFAHQVTGIQVHNYGARRSARDPHLELATDRAGGRIQWGSAPGDEVEENTVRRKLAILRDNFQRYGRLDANLKVIDISVYPDRFTARG